MCIFFDRLIIDSDVYHMVGGLAQNLWRKHLKKWVFLIGYRRTFVIFVIKLSFFHKNQIILSFWANMSPKKNHFQSDVVLIFNYWHFLQYLTFSYIVYFLKLVQYFFITKSNHSQEMNVKINPQEISKKKLYVADTVFYYYNWTLPPYVSQICIIEKFLGGLPTIYWFSPSDFTPPQWFLNQE